LKNKVALKTCFPEGKKIRSSKQKKGSFYFTKRDRQTALIKEFYKKKTFVLRSSWSYSSQKLTQKNPQKYPSSQSSISRENSIITYPNFQI